MTPKTEHTPTPWFVDGRGNYGGMLFNIHGSGQNPELPEPCQSVCCATGKGDTEYILLCVNSHANLVKELRASIDNCAMMLEWIDAVPKETQLPAMPGFDRDYVTVCMMDAKELLATLQAEEN